MRLYEAMNDVACTHRFARSEAVWVGYSPLSLLAVLFFLARHSAGGACISIAFDRRHVPVEKRPRKRRVVR